MGRSVRRRFALLVLRSRCFRVESARVCLGSYRVVVRNASTNIETVLARIPDLLDSCLHEHTVEVALMKFHTTYLPELSEGPLGAG